MLAPIPLWLLGSSMTVREPVDSDYGGEYATASNDPKEPQPYTIDRVRFDAFTQTMRLPYVLTDGARGLVFIDAVNSGWSKEVPEGSLVTIDGDEMAVLKVHRYESAGGLVHHWELEVG